MIRSFASKFVLPIFLSSCAFSSYSCAADYNPGYLQQANRYEQSQPPANPNQLETPEQTHESSNQSYYFNRNGRQEIAAVSRSKNESKNEDRPLYYQEHDRANWDYRQNWHRNRNAYLSGVNQSQFDDHLTPRYGYGPYNYPYNYYNNTSGDSELGVSVGNTRPYATNTYYPTNSYYNRYYGNYATTYPVANPTYYPQYGTSNYTVYPQYGYGSYSMNYPQSTYNTARINSYYGDGYYRNYRNDYYRNAPGGYETSRGIGSYYYDTNRPATTYPYYNVQPRSDSYHSYEFPAKTDMPYMPSPY